VASASNVAVPRGTGRPLFGQGLPHDGIQITAWLVGEDRPPTPNPNFPPRELPLQVFPSIWRIAGRDTQTSRHPPPGTHLGPGKRPIPSRLGLFGSDPSQEMRDAAQAELNRLFVPPAKEGAASP
jgi:hypothetical protein